MSEDRQRGGAARYLAMVACVLLGGFVYVGWRIKKGDELQKQHTLAAGIENEVRRDELTLTIPKGNDTLLGDDDDLLSDLTIGTDTEKDFQTLDTPDDIDIEALLSSTPEQSESGIGGVAGNSNSGIVLPETEQVSQSNLLPPPAPSAESFARAPSAPQLPESTDFLSPSPYENEAPQTTPIPTRNISVEAPVEDLAPSDALSHTSYKKYTVKRGDTLSKIAQRSLGSRKRANEIYAMNKDIMSSPNLLKVGMKLKIPFDRNSQRTSNHSISTTDSLPSIAMRYYGSAEPEIIEGIRLANPILSQGGFREGTKLTIPPLEVVQNTPVVIYADTPAGKERVYTIRSGDTLSKIAARKYGNASKWRSIYNANKDKIKKPSAIRVGMTIRLP